MSEVNNNISLAIYYNDKGEKVVISIANYKKMLLNKDREAIGNFIYNRLYGRYIYPFEESGYKNKRKNGFSMMASYCLLVETLQSFKNGWGDSNRKSSEAYKQFFTDNKDFSDCNEKGLIIYKHIRCGILHQGETTGGWLITRKKKYLIDEEKQKIDACVFGERLNDNLSAYVIDLKKSNWDSTLWDNFRVKMRKVIANTEVQK